MKLLYLTLKKIWFDYIAKGIKNVEYRKVKPYWTKRLIPKIHTHILFKNGYSRYSPLMLVEYSKLTTDKRKGLYNLHLGKILKIENWK